MSGHSKWSKIKHKKAATDAKKSKVFSKFAALIAVESKRAGGDVNSPGLRLAIERAKKENMPQTNIERAVKKGISKDAASLEAVTYETYGPGGAALIIEALTDNRNRTGAEVKHILSSRGFELAAPGSAAWAFEKKDGEWIAKTTMSLSENDKQSLEELCDALDDQDDVQSISTNADA